MCRNLLLIAFTVFITSCKTPLLLSDIKGYENVVVGTSAIPEYCQTDKVEYIGVKGASFKSHKFLRTIGEKLENQGLARNTQKYYTYATVSPDEMAKYNSKCRYVTYLDFETLRYGSEDIDYNHDLWYASFLVMTCSLYTLFPVYVPMLCCVDKNTCQMELFVKGNIVVYDTEKKEIIETIPIKFSRSDYQKGKYYHKKTDRDSIDKFYQSFFDNTVLDGYAHLLDGIK